MYYDRSKILDDEDCSPSNLCSQIFDIYRALISQASVMDCCVFCIGDDTAVGSFGDTQLMDGKIASMCKFRVNVGSGGSGA